MANKIKESVKDVSDYFVMLYYNLIKLINLLAIPQSSLIMV